MGKVSKINILLIVLWVVIVAFTMFHHELWRDEAQVWCIVRDLGIIDIFKMAKVEGHPILWYLFVMPFAKLGFSAFSMQIISFILVLSSIVFFIVKAPFSTILKGLFIFSTGMTYDVSVISRNYCLIPIIVFLLAELYPKRFNHPNWYIALIILLSQTHSLMLGLSGILALIFILENLKERKNILPISLLTLNFIGLFLYFLNSTNENTAVIGYEHLPFIDFLREFSTLFFIPLNNIIGPIANIALYIVLFSIFWVLFKQDKKLFIITLISELFIFFVLGFIWFGGILYQKAFMMFFPIIFAYWVIQKKSDKEFKLLKIAICTLCIFAFIRTPFILLQEVTLNFSGGKQIAEYIRKNLNNENEFIFVGDSFFITPISAYLNDKKIYSYNDKKYSTFYLFNSKTIEEPFPSNINYYIIQEDYEPQNSTEYKKIFSSNNSNLSTPKQREVYSIYLKAGK